MVSPNDKTRPGFWQRLFGGGARAGSSAQRPAGKPDIPKQDAWACEICGEAHDGSAVFCQRCRTLRQDQRLPEERSGIRRCRTCGHECDVDESRGPDRCPQCGDVLKASTAERGKAPEAVREAARQFLQAQHGTSWDQGDWLRFLEGVRSTIPARIVADWEVEELLKSEAAHKLLQARAQAVGRAQEAVREAARQFLQAHGSSWDHQGWLGFLGGVRSTVPALTLDDS
jgi:predicted RNA-binding Zn-ribbon protein involved in translation (DUF1610 family)